MLGEIKYYFELLFAMPRDTKKVPRRECLFITRKLRRPKE